MFMMSAILTAMLFVIAAMLFDVSSGKSELDSVLVRLLGIPCFAFLSLLAMGCGSLPTMGSALVLIAVALVFPPKRTAKYCLRAAAGIALIYAAGSIPGFRSIQAGNAWRANHPFESLAERTVSRRPVTPAPEKWQAAFAKDTREQTGQNTDRFIRNELKGTVFDDFENRIGPDNSSSTKRSKAIEAIHQSYVQQFANSPGFGVARNLRPSQQPERLFDYDEPPTVPQPQPLALGPPDPATPDGPAEPAAPKGNAPQQQGAGEGAAEVSESFRKELAGLHVNGMLDFFDVDDYGYVKSVNEVAGFRPHHFNKPPERRISTSPHETPFPWKLERLELVGLLLHEEPVVYLSENLPKMQPGGDMPTRPLDTFESESLKRLESGEEITTQTTHNNLRVLGAIRAAKECLKCHQVNRGDLLGAFSYRLRREPPLPVAKPAQESKPATEPKT